VQHFVVAQCSTQFTGLADGFLSHWNPCAELSLEAVALVHTVTWWSHPGEASKRLCALTLLVGSSGRKNQKSS